MKRKSLWKVLEAGVLALSLAMSPLAAISVQAAATTPPAPTEEKEGGSEKGKGTGDEVEIPVWGFTAPLDGAKIYSVDVEWGAMTFQYASAGGSGGVWDPATHKYITTGTTSQWYVYDSKTKSVSESAQSAINQVSITNHSNADVKAKVSYQSAGTTTVTGEFTLGEGTQAETSSTPDTKVLKLDSADNGKGADGAGEAVTGKVYFMPGGSMMGQSGPDQTVTWTQIGTITVGIDAAESQ